MNLTILQTNLGRARAAHDLMWAAAMTKKVDIIVVSEPNKKLMDKGGWTMDASKGVAAQITNRAIAVEGIVSGPHHVRIDLGRWHIICTYISPNIAFQEFKEITDEAFNEAAKYPRRAMVLGDINSKSREWGASQADRRGEYVEEWMAQLELRAANTGEPTFRRGMSLSHIDVTLAPDNGIVNWRIAHENPFTHHGHIYVKLGTNVAKRTATRSERRINLGRLKEELGKRRSLSVDEGPMDVYQKMKEATEAATEGKEDGGGRGVPYWWNQEIEDKRDECNRLRRRATRHRVRESVGEQIPELSEDRLKSSKRELKRCIRRAKKRCWLKLIGELDVDIWGQGYKIATKQLRGGGPPHQLTEKKRAQILEALFPCGVKNWTGRTEGEIPGRELEVEEIEAALSETKAGKAPGEDGITAEALREMFTQVPEWFQKMYGDLLRDQIFPGEWKAARAVLLPKKGKDLTLPSSYRPLCLLSVVGKVYERIILNRLTDEIEERKVLSPRQHGFRKERSTTTAILEVMKGVTEASGWTALVLLDVRNAFNSASWRRIVEATEHSGVSGYLVNIIRDYFGNRRVSSGKIRRQYTAGVPQGSVLGPTLWNLMYDGVLRLPYAAGVLPTAYADDLALVVQGEDEENLKRGVRDATRMVGRWLEGRELKIAPEKTEILILKGTRKLDVVFDVLGVAVAARKEVVYLGVTLRRGPSFTGHIEGIIKKAEERAAALRSILPNVGGPHYLKRRLLAAVVHGTVLYAAPAWRSALKQEKERQRIISTQRRALLRVIAAYRTVSAEAAQVLAGYPPMDLMVSETCYLFRVGSRTEGLRRQARKRTMREWQRRWETGTGALWTKRLIQDLESWVGCEYRRLDYYVTQFFTGHGSFGTYLLKIKKKESDMCQECGAADSPEHTFYVCARWDRERGALQDTIGRLPPPSDLVTYMTASRRNWDAIHEYIHVIMERKECEDRARDG